jgi:hypothetical protein
MGRNWDKPDVKDVKPAKEKSKGKSKATEDTATLPKTPDSSDPKPKAKKPRASTATSRAKSPNAAVPKVSKPKKKEPRTVPADISKLSDSLSPPPPAIPSGPKPHDPTKKQRPSHAFSFSDSSLTDEEMEGQTSKVGESSKVKPKPKKAKDGVKKPTKKDDGKVKAKAKEVSGKETTAVNGEKGKGKAEDVPKNGEKKVRAKPAKKPEVAVDPPVFEKVDTRLGRVEAEHRIMVSLALRAWLNLSSENIYAVSEMYSQSLSDRCLR